MEINYKIKTQTENANMSALSVLELLIGKAGSAEKEDIKIMSTYLVSYLTDKNLIQKTTFAALISAAFTIGYYYRLFIEKNSVEIIYADDYNPSDGIDFDKT